MPKNLLPYKCGTPGCNRLFAKPEHLRQHTKDSHSPPKLLPKQNVEAPNPLLPHKCRTPGCNQLFAKPEDLHQHTKDSHLPSKPLPNKQEALAPKRVNMYKHVHALLQDVCFARNRVFNIESVKYTTTDPVTSLVLSHECRRTLIKVASELGLDGDARLRDALDNDEQDILDHVVNVIRCPEATKAALKLEGENAQQLLDVMHTMLSNDYLIMSKEDRSKTRIMMLKLCEAFDTLPSSIFIDDVTNRDGYPISSGNFAEVYLAQYNGQLVALKHLRVSTKRDEARAIRLTFYQEAIALHDLKHPYILPLIGIYRESSSLFMVSSWMGEGTILSHLQAIGRQDVNRLLYEIAQAIQYLHSQDLVHGDLRGQNIVVTNDWHPRLLDFGLSRYSEASRHSSREGGSVRWMAPELIDPGLFGIKFLQTFASDMYAFGCLCLELYTLQPPFSSVSEEFSVMRQVAKGRRPGRPTEDPIIPDILWQCITACWEEDPANRPSANDVESEMRQVVAEFPRISHGMAAPPERPLANNDMFIPPVFPIFDRVELPNDVLKILTSDYDGWATPRSCTPVPSSTMYAALDLQEGSMAWEFSSPDTSLASFTISDLHPTLLLAMDDSEAAPAGALDPQLDLAPIAVGPLNDVYHEDTSLASYTIPDLHPALLLAMDDGPSLSQKSPQTRDMKVRLESSAINLLDGAGGEVTADLPKDQKTFIEHLKVLQFENNLHKLNETRVGTFVIYSPDHELPDPDNASLNPDDLAADLGIEGCSISVHEPVAAVAWIENNWGHPLLNSFQDKGCAGPLASMLCPKKPALVLFGPYNDPFVANAAQSLAKLSGFPVMIRPSGDNPIGTLLSGDTDPGILSLAGGGNQAGGETVSHHGGDGTAPILRNEGAAETSHESGERGDHGEEGSEQSGDGGDPGNGNEDTDPQINRDPYPKHGGAYRGLAGAGGGDGDDGEGGPTTTDDRWESQLHSTSLKLRLKLHTNKPYTISIAYDFKFQINRVTDLPIDLEQLTRPLSQPEIIALVDFKIENRPRETRVDRSYASIGFVAHREESIRKREFLHRGGDLPDKVYKRGQQQQNQLGLAGTLGLSSGKPVATAAFSYTKTRGVAVEATDSKVMPRYLVDYEPGDEWDDAGKSYTSFNIAYESQKAQLDVEPSHLDLRVMTGMGINLRPSGSEQTPPKLSFINRNQVLIWVLDPTSKSRARGIVVLMSSYLDNIRGKETLSIYEQEDVDLVNAAALNTRETKQEEHKPGTISVSIANVEGQSTLNARRLAIIPALRARFGQRPATPVVDIPGHEILARGWDATNNQWRNVLWPALDHNLQAAEVEGTSPVWKIEWKVTPTTPKDKETKKTAREGTGAGEGNGKGKGKEKGPV